MFKNSSFQEGESEMKVLVKPRRLPKIEKPQERELDDLKEMKREEDRPED
jgi:hypothetical protein